MPFGPFFTEELFKFTFTLRDKESKALLDLTGTTAKVFFRKRNAPDNKWTATDTDATVVVPEVNGVIEYTMPDAWDVDDDIGPWELQVRTDKSGDIRRSEKVSFMVEAGL